MGFSNQPLLIYLLYKMWYYNQVFLSLDILMTLAHTVYIYFICNTLSVIKESVHNFTTGQSLPTDSSFDSKSWGRECHEYKLEDSGLKATLD